MNLDCNVVMDLVSLYHDEEVSFVTRLALDKHIKECKNCQEYYKDYKILPQKPLAIDFSGEQNYSKLAKKMRTRRLISLAIFLAYVSASLFAIIFMSLKMRNDVDEFDVFDDFE